jgi:hypothetical protein
MTGDAHPIKESAKHAWLALVIVSDVGEREELLPLNMARAWFR